MAEGGEGGGAQAVPPPEVPVGGDGSAGGTEGGSGTDAAVVGTGGFESFEAGEGGSESGDAGFVNVADLAPAPMHDGDGGSGSGSDVAAGPVGTSDAPPAPVDAGPTPADIAPPPLAAPVESDGAALPTDDGRQPDTGPHLDDRPPQPLDSSRSMEARSAAAPPPGGGGDRQPETATAPSDETGSEAEAHAPDEGDTPEETDALSHPDASPQTDTHHEGQPADPAPDRQGDPASGGTRLAGRREGAPTLEAELKRLEQALLLKQEELWIRTMGGSRVSAAEARRFAGGEARIAGSDGDRTSQMLRELGDSHGFRAAMATYERTGDVKAALWAGEHDGVLRRLDQRRVTNPRASNERMKGHG